MLVPAGNTTCTKCVSCRLGSAQVLAILDELAQGRGRPGMLETLWGLVETMRLASDCPVGKSAPDIVRFTLERFPDQYEAHIHEKACPFHLPGGTAFHHTTCPLRATGGVQS